MCICKRVFLKRCIENGNTDHNHEYQYNLDGTKDTLQQSPENEKRVISQPSKQNEKCYSC